MRVRTALSVAGSDPSGGAGIQADLKVFLDRGVYGMAVLAGLTAQNTRGVSAVAPVEPAFLREQLRAVFADMPVDAMKTGMLGDAARIDAVCDVLEALPVRPPLVVDPVMVAKGGAALLDPKAVDAMRRRLLPLAAVVTPNLPEAEALGEAALAELKAYVLIKGGHGEGPWVVDSLRWPGGKRDFRHRRVSSENTHGTGCTLSSALAAELAKGAAMEAATAVALRYVSALVRRGALGTLGSGHGPLLHGLGQG